MKIPFDSSPLGIRQTREQFATSDADLSYELGKAVQELPPIYPRLLALSISLLVFGAIAWAAVSKVDEVAVAEGQIGPPEEAQPVRSLYGGTIKAIKIQDGQPVNQGDVLVELRSEDIQKRIDNLDRQVKNLHSKWVSEVMVAQQALSGLQKDLKFAEEGIRFKGYLEFKDVDPKLIPLPSLEAAREVELLRNQVKVKNFEILQLSRAYTQELTRLEGEIEQAKTQLEQTTMRSPVSGKVYGLKITPAQATVQPGQELLSILPNEANLLLKVNVLNRDIGFVRPDMKVKVKLATFPFQEFGTIDGTVIQVSPNGIMNEKLGLVFPTRVKLQRDSIRVRGQEIKLFPGMAATGEIVLRRKSVLSFLVEPVTKRFDEAFSVR
jgi:HlyD family secretion protein